MYITKQNQVAKFLCKWEKNIDIKQFEQLLSRRHCWLQAKTWVLWLTYTSALEHLITKQRHKIRNHLVDKHWYSKITIDDRSLVKIINNIVIFQFSMCVCQMVTWINLSREVPNLGIRNSVRATVAMLVRPGKRAIATLMVMFTQHVPPEMVDFCVACIIFRTWNYRH